MPETRDIGRARAVPDETEALGERRAAMGSGPCRRVAHALVIGG